MRLPPELLATDGASGGDTYVYNPATDEMEFGTGGGGGIVDSVVAGTGISVDDTDPANPVVSATGGGSSEFWVGDYGAVGNGNSGSPTDDTNAIIAAVDAAIAAGGGDVMFEAKVYLCNGALRTDRNGNAVIPIPVTRHPIRFRGVTPTNQCDPRSDTGYTILKTTKTGLSYSGTDGVPSLLGGPTDGTWADTMVSIENICFWLPHDPTLAGVDLRYVRRMLWDGCTVVALNVGDSDFVQPTSVYAFGLRTPESQNYNAVLVRNGGASGMYAGIVGSAESLTMDYWSSKWCVIGWAPMTGGHGADVGKLSTEWCNYHMSGWTEAAGVASVATAPTGETKALLTISEWAIEDASSGWYTTTDHLYDPTNRFYGTVQYDHYVIGTGTTTGLTVSGATNLHASPLLAPTTGGVPTSRAVNTDSTLTGGGDLTADRTLGVDTTAEAERIRDVIGAALVGGTNITITVNDAGDTITISGSGSGVSLQPLTTVINGVPDLVWDADNQLVMTEGA